MLKQFQKLYVLGALGSLLFNTGCGNEDRQVFQDEPLPEKGNMTLIRKEIYAYGQSPGFNLVYYFDRDGDLKTAEVVLRTRPLITKPILSFKNDFNKAQVGMVKSIKQWHNDLTDKKFIDEYEYVR